MKPPQTHYTKEINLLQAHYSFTLLVWCQEKSLHYIKHQQ